MKIFVCASKHNYKQLDTIIKDLGKLDHDITLPNSYENPFQEEEMKKLGREKHSSWKTSMFKLQEQKVNNSEAILVVNLDKKETKNHIGGSVFLEIYEAWKLNKKIFLFNPLPDNILKDELEAMNPIIINGDLKKID